MAFLSGTAFAADFFRVSYQSAEAAFNGPVAPQPGVLDRIGRIIQIQIAVFDAFFTIEHYTGILHGLERFKDLIVPLRLAAIVQGLYQLLNDPNADRESIQRSIFLNTLNIGSFAMRILKRGTANPSVHTYLDYASLACTLSDALYRGGLTYSHRTAIANKLSDLYQGIDLKQMAAAAVQKVMNVASTIDHYAGYPLRIFVTALIANEFFRKGFISLQKATKADSNIIHGFLMIAGLGYGLVKLAQKAVHGIFDKIGIPQNTIRQITEWSFSLIIGGILTAATAKGAGFVQSFSAMLKIAYPTVLMFTIYSSLNLIIVIGGIEFNEELGIQPDTVKGLILLFSEAIIAGGTIMLLSGLSAVGFGIASTHQEASKLLFSSITIFTSIFNIWLATTTAGNALISGVPSWEELAALFVIYSGTSSLFSHFDPDSLPLVVTS